MKKRKKTFASSWKEDRRQKSEDHYDYGNYFSSDFQLRIENRSRSMVHNFYDISKAILGSAWKERQFLLPVELYIIEIAL